MAVVLIDKIMPKNDAFVGLVDADQVIGLSGFVGSGTTEFDIAPYSGYVEATYTKKTELDNASGVLVTQIATVSGTLSTEINTDVAALSGTIDTNIANASGASVITASGIAVTLDTTLHTTITSEIATVSGALSSEIDSDVAAVSGTLVTYTDTEIASASGSAVTEAGTIADGLYLKKNGTTPLTSDWDAKKFIATSGVAATDAGGLSLLDDDGNGIFVADGGNVSIGTNPSGYKFEVGTDTPVGGIVGRAAIGDWEAFGLSPDYAVFGHIDSIRSVGGFAIIQYNSGATWVNAETGQDLKFTIGGGSNVKMTINAAGNIDVTGTVDGRDIAADGLILDAIDLSALSGTLTTYTDTEIAALSGTLITDIATVSGTLSTEIDTDITALSGTVNTNIANASGASVITASGIAHDLDVLVSGNLVTQIATVSTEVGTASGTLSTEIASSSGTIVAYVDNISGVIVAQIETPAGVVLTNGTVPLTADWDTKKIISASGIAATDAGGLSLYDDDGNGILVEDGGNVVIGTNPSGYKFEVGTDTPVGGVIGRAAIGDWEAFGLSPDYAVFGHIDSIRSVGGFAIIQYTSGATWVNAETGQDLKFTIGGGSNVKMTVDGINGYVGIGTTSPLRTLHVKGSIGLNDDSYIDTIGGYTRFLTATSSAQPIKIGGLVVSNSYTASAPTDGAYIKGNVGIEVVTPVDRLHIHKPTSARSAVRFSNSTTGSAVEDGCLVGLNNNEQLEFWNFEETDLRIATNNAERMRITAAGDVGIGTIYPDAKLHIAHPNTGATIRLENSSQTVVNDDAYGTIEFEGKDTSPSAGGVRAKMVASAASSNGDTGATALIFYITESASTTLIETMRMEKLVAGNQKTTITGNLGVSGSISSATLELTTGTYDAVNVSGVSAIFVDTSGGDVTIGGTIGGVDGQLLNIAIHDATNDTTLEDQEGTGNQDFVLHAGNDEVLTGMYGGWTFINHGGGHWYDCSHAKHV